jgi:hypothetical protein
MQLHLVGQYKLQGIHAGVFCLLNIILLRDEQNGLFTPSHIPLALLGLQSIRDCLQVTHSPQVCSEIEMCTNEQSFEKLLDVPFGGIKTYP